MEPVPGDATPAMPRPPDAPPEVHPPHSPLSADADGVRLEPRRTGHRLLDFTIAGSAILISLISLGVAVHLGQVQQRLVAANSWPFLQFGSTSSAANGTQWVSVGISNDGAGAAILKSLVVRYQGKVVRGWVELLQACCGLRQGIAKADLDSIGPLEESSLIGVLRAREQVTMLKLVRTSSNVEMWQRFSIARGALTFQACYCSIVGECWTSDLHTLDPKPVKSCPKNPADYLELGAGMDGDWKLPVVEAH
ncbi:MAG TPA: hypothetical protein VIE42_11755 [Steroidobacteraceae bacterium]